MIRPAGLVVVWGPAAELDLVRPKRYFAKRNNPWELLPLTALFIVAAVIMLPQQRSFVSPSFGNRVARFTVWSPSELQVLGWCGVGIAIIFGFLYLYARRYANLISGDKKLR